MYVQSRYHNGPFHYREDMYCQESIDLLQNSGIQFKKHEEEGIDVNDFAELLMTSGIVLNDNVKWLSFHRYWEICVNIQVDLRVFAHVKILVIPIQYFKMGEFQLKCFVIIDKNFYPGYIAFKLVVIWLINCTCYNIFLSKSFLTFIFFRLDQSFKTRPDQNFETKSFQISHVQTPEFSLHFEQHNQILQWLYQDVLGKF